LSFFIDPGAPRQQAKPALLFQLFSFRDPPNRFSWFQAPPPSRLLSLSPRSSTAHRACTLHHPSDFSPPSVRMKIPPGFFGLQGELFFGPCEYIDTIPSAAFHEGLLLRSFLGPLHPPSPPRTRHPSRPPCCLPHFTSPSLEGTSRGRPRFIRILPCRSAFG